MSESISCPQCQSKLRLPENVLGKRVRCPACNTAFVAGGEGAMPQPVPVAPTPVGVPAPPSPYDYVGSPPAYGHAAPAMPPPPAAAPAYPPPPHPGTYPTTTDEDIIKSAPVSEAAQTWRSVGSGVYLQMLAHYLHLGGLGLLFFVFLIALTASGSRHGPDPGAGAFLGILVVVAMFLVVLNWVVSLIATSFWIMAPLTYSARGFGVATLLFTTVTVLRLPDVFVVSTSMMTHRGGGPFDDLGGGPEVQVARAGGLLLFYLLEVARLTLIAIFLRAVARNCRNQSLASAAHVLAIATPCIYVGVTLFVILLAMAGGGPRGGPAVGIIIIFLSLAAPAAVLLWGALTLQRARNTLRRAEAEL